MSRIRFDNPDVVDDERESVRSVGRALEAGQIYSMDHPAYKAFSLQLSREIEELARRDEARRAAAEPLVLPYSVTSEEAMRLGVVYPELSVIPVPINYPVHRMWTASRYAANALVAQMASRYSDEVVHLGGARLPAMARADRRVHVEYVKSVPEALHAQHEDLMNLHRVFRDFSFMQSDYGISVPRAEFDAFVDGEAYGACSDVECVHRADAVCVDLSMYAMSPDQVAAYMEQHGSTVAFGFFVYHPSMLITESGVLPGTGVHYKKTKEKIQFLYPDGNAGVNAYDKSMWACWLTSHCFRVADNWYQLELLKNRDDFMFFRIVKVDAAPGKATYVHALELPANADAIFVRSWRLRAGLKSDPARANDWERNNFLVAARTEKRVREYAMQLKPENFSRFAIKKQIRVVNNRWVLSGTTVTVMPPLDPVQVEDLTTAIFSRTFVDRYESSRLSREMMDALGQLKAFNSASVAQRILAVSRAVAAWGYDGSVGILMQWLKEKLDKFACWVMGKPAAMPVSMQPPPTYMLLSSAVGTVRAFWNERGEASSAVADLHSYVDAEVTLPGGGLLAAVRAARAGAAVLAGGLAAVTRVVSDYVDVSLGADGEAGEFFAAAVERNNALDYEASSRHIMEYETAEREGGELRQEFQDAADPDPAESLNQLYREVLPTVAGQDFTGDPWSLSLDPQDRTLAAVYLRMPLYFGEEPRPRTFYRSKVQALNVPKRQNTGQDLLTAVGQRNLSAPVICQPQDEQVLIAKIWETFLDDWCVPNAREKLAGYASDTVALGEQALKDWVSKAKPEVVQKLMIELQEQEYALEGKTTGEYLAMIKADVKPSLSVKPVSNVVAPQVIVYHEKILSALYSSMFRVLVRRFLSLLKANIHVNLLKDTRDIAEFIQANHPFGQDGLMYLENDFSQYDKSQAGFVFALEEHVFRALGLNEEFLQQWCIGHHFSNVRCVAVGLSLHTMYQRKSGDATTAFGNVILNVLSVHHAYGGTRVVWAVFMGDDSLVCTTKVAGDATAVRVLAEVFNLIAKYYVTEAPYFASNFIVIDEEAMQVSLLPDVIKRVEKLSMSISGDDPQWNERWISCCDTLSGYRDLRSAAALARLVPQRYQVPEGYVRGAASALGTIAKDKRAFRSLWEEDPQLLDG